MNTLNPNLDKQETKRMLKRLKIQTWFNAVSETSGKTAYQLEAEFAPSYLGTGLAFQKGRSRVWAKYKRGDVMPTYKETEGGRVPIALLVEEKYPGTLKWLTHPIWELADPFIDFNMQDLKPVYESLPEKYRSYFIEENPEHPYFWRKQNDDLVSMLDVFAADEGVDGLTAILCLYRESIIFVNEEKYSLLHSTFTKLSTKPNLNIYYTYLTNLISQSKDSFTICTLL